MSSDTQKDWWEYSDERSQKLLRLRLKTVILSMSIILIHGCIKVQRHFLYFSYLGPTEHDG